MGRSGIVSTDLAQARKASMNQWIEQINDKNITWGHSSKKDTFLYADILNDSTPNVPDEVLGKKNYPQLLYKLSEPKLSDLGAMTSIYDLPIPGLTKPEPPAKVVPRVASQHSGRRFR